MISWEPQWRTHGAPAVGDYIQVEWSYPDTGECGAHEGLVTRCDGALVFTAPHGPVRPDGTHHDAVRWRLGFPAEQAKIERRALVDA